MKLPEFLAIILFIAAASGCASHRSQPNLSQPVVVKTKPIVTPDPSLSAKVVSYNADGRFVVLSFSSSQLPNVDQTLFLYRNGLKTAELKVSKWRSENNVAADVVAGDAQVGDEVRDE
jgi:hypothetical protein